MKVYQPQCSTFADLYIQKKNASKISLAGIASTSLLDQVPVP